MKNKSDFIFGIHSVIEAIRSGKSIDKLLIRKGVKSEELLYEVSKFSIPVSYVPNEKLNSITGRNHQGVIAYISPVEFADIDKIIPALYEEGKSPFILILDSITDVRNFGSICRTAECAGVHAIVIPTKNSAQIGGDAVQTSSGALLNIPICKTSNPGETIVMLKNSGLNIIAATEKGNTLYHQNDLSQPVAIIFGSENKGVSADLIQKTDVLAKIPLFGKTESMNVSSAAAIFIYEVIRQRSTN